jgi:hypothetical protein
MKFFILFFHLIEKKFHARDHENAISQETAKNAPRITKQVYGGKLHYYKA